MPIFANLRFPTAVSFGLLLMASMFWMLWSLTNVTFEIISIPTTRIEFTRILQDTDSPQKFEKTIEREVPPVIPEKLKIGTTEEGIDSVLLTMKPEFDNSVSLAKGQFGASGNDTDVIPLVRVSPDYPPRAVVRGIEGWVQVQFNISATGTVTDAVVVASEPQNVFDEAALTAISRWRYNPKVEGAIAVERRGVQTMLRFNLE